VRQSFYSRLCDNFQLSACSVSFASQSGCIAKTDVRSKPFNSRPPKAPLYSIGPPICFEQALRSSVGTHNSDPMMKSDGKCQKEGLMTRMLLLTAAIVALALAPSIGTGTAQARGFGGGGVGGGFHGGFGGDFHGGGFGRGFYGGTGRGFHGGFGGGFYGGYGGFYPGYYGYGYSPYCYYCY
jgi:hypothetical protein